MRSKAVILPSAVQVAGSSLWITLRLHRLFVVSLAWAICSTLATCSPTRESHPADVIPTLTAFPQLSVTPETPGVEPSPTRTSIPEPLLRTPYADGTQAPATRAPTSTPVPTPTNTAPPPCGKRIAFQSQQRGVDSIALVDVCSRQVSWLTDGQQPAVDPKWSPDGRYLAFLAQPVQTAFELVSNLWLIDVVSYEFSQITPDPRIGFSESASALDYVWSPNGRELLVAISEQDSSRAAIVRLADRDTRVLPEGLYPPFSWSPDGSKIALKMLTPDRISGGDEWVYWSGLLVVIRPDGRWAEESHYALRSEYDWHWSPDSQLLAIVASPDGIRGIGDILLYEVEGDNWILRKRLKDLLPAVDVEDYGVLSFDWSPSGEEMAFVIVHPDDLYIHWGQVHVADRDLTRIRTLTPEGMYCVDVQWSPDGSQLAFVCEDGELYSLWVVDADGTNLHRITEPAEGTRRPQWQPLSEP